MTQVQAENRAERLNRTPHHEGLSYMAHPMASTRWEKDRWGVQPVKDYMLEHLVKQIEDTPLEPEDRKALLALLDKADEK